MSGFEMIWPDFIDPQDVARGDVNACTKLPSGLELHVIESVFDSRFEIAFQMLDSEFGPNNEMETSAVIARRLAHNKEPEINGRQMKYGLMLLSVSNEYVGVCDHTAISQNSSDNRETVVHVSHALVQPAWRRRGLSAVLRTLPLNTVRKLCAETGARPHQTTLFCEMEPLDLSLPANAIRRNSFEKAGYRAIGGEIGYLQPDLRPSPLIDLDPAGTRPVPLDIVLRRVDREDETVITGKDLSALIETVYIMYAACLGSREMSPCLEWLHEFNERQTPSYVLQNPTTVK